MCREKDKPSEVKLYPVSILLCKLLVVSQIEIRSNKDTKKLRHTHTFCLLLSTPILLHTRSLTHVQKAAHSLGMIRVHCWREWKRKGTLKQRGRETRIIRTSGKINLQSHPEALSLAEGKSWQDPQVWKAYYVSSAGFHFQISGGVVCYYSDKKSKRKISYLRLPETRDNSPQTIFQM